MTSLFETVRRLLGARSRPILGLALAAGCGLVAVAAGRGDWLSACLAALLTALALAPAGAAARGLEASGAAEPLASAGGDRSLFACLPDPVVLVDERAVVMHANAAAAAIAPGLRAGSPLALALRAPELLDAIPAVLREGKGAKVEIGGRMAGEPTYAVALNPVLRGHVSGAAVALTFRDLTEQRRTERMRVDFVANVSHELRTPLASILGFVETLQGPARNDPAARDRFLTIIRDQASRMSRLIDDLLQLSRVELRAHLPPSGTVGMAATVSHMVEILTPLARDRNVTIDLDLPPAPVEVAADRDELLRVVENLIANAIKYGGGGGRVEVRVSRNPDGRHADLSVRDHGPGIAPEHLPRLTERFYRVDVAESRAQAGTGLGLAIVKHVVARHRGRLAITSEPGQGARVTASFPLAQGGPADPHRHSTVIRPG
jgi:two-component system phosphate regulon sensor histidine kinase PhoR